MQELHKMNLSVDFYAICFGMLNFGCYFVWFVVAVVICHVCAHVRATFHTAPEIGLESHGVREQGMHESFLFGGWLGKSMFLDHTPLDRSRFL
jgi:hypothetical protein